MGFPLIYYFHIIFHYNFGNWMYTMNFTEMVSPEMLVLYGTFAH